MPNYEYQCTKCETVYEQWQEVGAAAPPCPECASTEVKKVFHPPRVHFKGSGFYLTDLRAEKAGATGKKSETVSSESASKPAEPKTEAKPEVKSDKPAAPSPSGAASK